MNHSNEWILISISQPLEIKGNLSQNEVQLEYKKKDYVRLLEIEWLIVRTLVSR